MIRDDPAPQHVHTPGAGLPWRLVALWSVASAAFIMVPVAAMLALEALFQSFQMRDVAHGAVSVAIVGGVHVIAFAGPAAAWGWAAYRAPSLDRSTLRLWSFAAAVSVLLVWTWLMAGLMRQSDVSLRDDVPFLVLLGAWYAFAFAFARYIVRPLRRGAFSGPDAGAPGLPRWARPRTLVLAYAAAWLLTAGGVSSMEREVAPADPNHRDPHALAIAPGLIRVTYVTCEYGPCERLTEFHAWIPGAHRLVAHDE